VCRTLNPHNMPQDSCLDYVNGAITTGLGVTRVGICAEGYFLPWQNVNASTADCEICPLDSYCAGSTETQCRFKQRTISPGQTRVDDCKCEVGYYSTTYHTCVGIVDPMVYTRAHLTNQDQTARKRWPVPMGRSVSTASCATVLLDIGQIHKHKHV